MHYLIFDPTMPEPYGKFTWSLGIENATPFSSLEDANSKKSAIPNATGMIQINGNWYIIKE